MNYEDISKQDMLHMTNSERNAETYFSFIKSQEVTLFTAFIIITILLLS
jgi:hypothetical protein